MQQQIPCEAFRKNPDGSWTCIKPVTISRPTGQIQIGPGMTFTYRTVKSASNRQDRLDGRGTVCARCGEYTFFAGSHVIPRIPIKQGGSRKAENCVIFCDKCYFEIGQDNTKEIPYSELQFYKV